MRDIQVHGPHCQWSGWSGVRSLDPSSPTRINCHLPQSHFAPTTMIITWVPLWPMSMPINITTKSILILFACAIIIYSGTRKLEDCFSGLSLKKVNNNRIQRHRSERVLTSTSWTLFIAHHRLEEYRVWLISIHHRKTKSQVNLLRKHFLIHLKSQKQKRSHPWPYPM